MNRTVTRESRQLARTAARWLALLDSGRASADDLQQLQHWRAANPQHEQIWQRAEGLRQRFQEVPPALAMASLDRPETSRRTLLKRGLALALLLPAGGLLSQQTPLQALRADLRTAVGERRGVRLADGSLLQLNTATAVNLDLAHQRLTLVEGEIALSVSRAQALHVDLGMARVSVGQAQVCLRRDAEQCRIAVLHGSVQVQPRHGTALALQVGDQLTINADGSGAMDRFDPHQPDWRDGVLSVNNQPLGQFLRELSRYRPGWLRWDPALESLRVTGTFRLDDTDRVLALLAASLPVAVQARSRYWITLVAQQKTA
ncbi:FecR domain-containing protein [Pseudomonas wadenswilerensis]|jgi:transmembrane sensor|uniref:FecR domain-containing protein n=1 Tax=Pseudomonas wadenswilerensis TaxID=1785161 RepID=UPI000F92F029|nr:FecR domain-containing protein [Pseudomonas wadenswilerensis]UVM23944.1 FecR domain-containing protein [Pseudomonas wadenswilerensis]